MKKILIAVVSVGILSSKAMACYAPTPICALAGGIILVETIIEANKEKVVKGLVISSEEAEVAKLTNQLRTDDNYWPGISSYSTQEYTQYTNYVNSKDQKVQLWAANILQQKRFKAHLDKMETAFVDYFGADRVAAAYGDKVLEDGSVNLNYYYLLINDLRTINSNFYAVR